MRTTSLLTYSLLPTSLLRPWLTDTPPRVTVEIRVRGFGGRGLLLLVNGRMLLVGAYDTLAKANHGVVAAAEQVEPGLNTVSFRAGTHSVSATFEIRKAARLVIEPHGANGTIVISQELVHN